MRIQIIVENSKQDLKLQRSKWCMMSDASWHGIFDGKNLKWNNSVMSCCAISCISLFCQDLLECNGFKQYIQKVKMQKLTQT